MTLQYNYLIALATIKIMLQKETYLNCSLINLTCYAQMSF